MRPKIGRLRPPLGKATPTRRRGAAAAARAREVAGELAVALAGGAGRAAREPAEVAQQVRLVEVARRERHVHGARPLRRVETGEHRVQPDDAGEELRADSQLAAEAPLEAPPRPAERARDVVDARAPRASSSRRTAALAPSRGPPRGAPAASARRPRSGGVAAGAPERATQRAAARRPRSPRARSRDRSLPASRPAAPR